MTDAPPHPPVICPGCGAVVGCETDLYTLLLPNGDEVISVNMIHACGRRFHWDKRAVLVERFRAITRQS